MIVRSDSATAAYKKIWDTFGIVRGTELPDQIVMVGGHRDAWGPGAERQRERHGERAGVGTRGDGGSESRAEAEAHDDLRDLGR